VSTALVTTPITPELVRGALELERTEHGLAPPARPPGPPARARRPAPRVPDAATHELIAERFAALVFGPGGP
jgi:hypothetical protein